MSGPRMGNMPVVELPKARKKRVDEGQLQDETKRVRRVTALLKQTTAILDELANRCNVSILFAGIHTAHGNPKQDIYHTPDLELFASKANLRQSLPGAIMLHRSVQGTAELASLGQRGLAVLADDSRPGMAEVSALPRRALPVC